MTELPIPLTPADCNLRGLPYMPLQVIQLLDSDLFIKSTGDEFKAAVALWCKSWNQLPGGSLPNDDQILAALSGAKSWKKVKEMAMRGWFLCADGRLYHKTVAENVLRAWESREDYLEKQDNKDSRQERWRARCKQLTEQLRAIGITPPQGAKLKALEQLLSSALETKNVDGSVDTNVDANVDGGVSTRDKNEMPYKLTEEKGELTTKPKSSHTSSSVDPADASDRDDSKIQHRNVAISILLRAIQVKPMTAMHPLAVEWGNNPKVTDALLTDAVETARQYKPEGDIHPNYLKPIVEEKLNPKPQNAGNAWRKTPQGIEQMGAKLGMRARGTEDHKTYADRIAIEIRNRKSAPPPGGAAS